MRPVSSQFAAAEKVRIRRLPSVASQGMTRTTVPETGIRGELRGRQWTRT